MPSDPSTIRTLASAIRQLPNLRHELVALLRDHRTVVDQVRRAEGQLADLSQRMQQAEDGIRGLNESVERLHRTLVEADPHMALDIATSVRDDVRTLLVEVAEQANLVRDHLVGAPRSAQTDEHQPQG